MFEEDGWETGGVSDAESAVEEEDEVGAGGVSVVGIGEGAAVWEGERLVLDVDHGGMKKPSQEFLSTRGFKCRVL